MAAAAELARIVADRDLALLMDVARRARNALPMLQPASAFRESLRAELIASAPFAGQRQRKRMWLRRHALATAVAGGAAAAGTGLVLYLRLHHARSRQAARLIPGA